MLMFFPFYPALLVAAESDEAMDKRLRKIATGGVNAGDGTRLIITEKTVAATGGGKTSMSSKPCGEASDFYRARVAAKAA